MENKKTTTTKKKTTSSSAKKPSTAKKVSTGTKKTTTTSKSAAAKKSTTTKKSVATKAGTKKTSSTTKKTTATKKTTTTKKPATSKTTSKKIDALIKEVDKPIDPIEKLIKESEQKKKIEAKEVVIEEPTKKEEIVESKNYNEKPELVTKKKKLKLKIKPLLKLLILIIVIVLATIYVPKFFDKKDSYKDKATYSTSFFIKNNKGKYALFNDKGKKLTDFIFDSANSFIDNSALVYKEKEGYKIINEKGKDVVAYGKYNYISNYSGLYKVRSDKGYKLLNSDGKTIIDAEELDVSSYGDDYPFVIAIANNEIKIISYDGTVIKSLKQNKTAKSPTVNHISEYSTLFYDGTTIVFNAKTKKVITKFSSNTHYCVNDASEDGKILTLNACTAWFETLTENGHKVIVKDKVTDLSKDCDSLTINENIVVCSSVNGDRFVEISGKKAKLGNKISNRTAYIDEENYVTRNNSTYKLEFYKKGKKVKTMDASLSSIGKMYNDMYVLYVDNAYEFYGKDGKKAIKESFKYASSFDKNNLARVSKDGLKYYLLNEKGKKIGDEYSSISSYDEYYLVSNKDNLKGIINKKGKVVIDTKYSSINIKQIRDKYYAIATTKEGKYILYNLDNGKQIQKSSGTITVNDHYVKVSENNKTSYYTYKGKLIYSE
ncbi:MAG: WG repeat-containing protein [Bacilli bacterium]|nr:WG repeat-containing protein [Bacilli bacterium]